MIRNIISNAINPKIQPVEPVLPIRDVLAPLSRLTSKAIREAKDIADNTICSYKIGLELQEGQVINWCKRIRKLTSVRLRSTLLRVAHGDVYSNSRLHKFGMIDSPKCNNCNEPAETIVHKLLTCPKARETWNILNAKKAAIGIDATNLTIEGILGIDSTEKLDLTLNATTLQILISRAGKVYCPMLLIDSVIKTIYNNDKEASQLKNLLHHSE